MGAVIVINCPGRQKILATPLVVPWKKKKNNEKRGVKKETKKVEK